MTRSPLTEVVAGDVSLEVSAVGCPMGAVGALEGLLPRVFAKVGSVVGGDKGGVGAVRTDELAHHPTPAIRGAWHSHHLWEDGLRLELPSSSYRV